ncbi:hypothetical protein PHAVU_010G055200 [Phaseolus vulgaris]|uniref:ADP-ribosyl cyclase/cyclic ADP-ribose hydrolase n=1 Tax=Phaseolus vulgaris TaxID=3885 RepID=V7AMM9_PHAVU|nr:hypothetical protein PHAVU_010G055200g [Phaseolus vulgaris]ESW06525.1 hypothetical protein PHAVU_010G055200g [Phaseolus vulgaris]
MASNAIIQYTSSSSSLATHIYDVFVSFRGEDTRNTFTSFLFQALRTKGIIVFKDDEDLKKGESIAPELLQAIQASRLFIVVFSQNYASSTWCLRELAEIRNCIERRVIIPIFYDVDPSVVRKQGGCYEKAFAEHEKRFGEDEVKMEEVQRWRQALTQVANLSGWDIRNKSQCEPIEEIVQNIINIVGPKMSKLPKDELVGIESRVRELTNTLRLDSINDVRVVGISGMGGIGKTTLARALYERIYHQYDRRCFIDDVSKIYRDSGLLGVQKQLISQSLNVKNLEICNAIDGTYWVWTRLHNARTLLVLDNVDQGEQLKMFTANRDIRGCVGEGSRVVIISRDEHILKTHGVDDVYQVQLLSWENAVQLFCRNAFKVNYILDDYEELAREVLSHAQGHPLAIEIIGSSLFGRNVSQWRSALSKLRYNKDRNIMDVLRISFDQLKEEEKEIFLDIACFLYKCGYSKDEVEKFLRFRGFDYENGIPALIEKSLITCEDGVIYMHRLLMDLGQSIVREKSPKEPLKWSRLWDYEDFKKAMLDNEATENLEVIYIKPGWHRGTVKADGLSKIRHLKLLKFMNVSFSGSLNHLSNELAYLQWSGYPFKCLPQSFQPEKLVELYLVGSSIKQLWEGTKPLQNLKFLDLSYSEDLVEMPDVRDALNLEKIELKGCIKLRKINPSIGLLKKLAFLNLGNCKNLVSLPHTILDLNSLEYLNVSGCSKLYNNELLDERRNKDHLKKLCLVEAHILSQSTPSFIKKMFLQPSDLLFPSSPTLPCSLTCLRELDLSFCKLVRIPDVIGKLSCLERLNLKGNNFTTLPNLQNLFRLYHLNLQHCKKFKRLPVLPLQTDYSSEFCKLPLSCFTDEKLVGLIIYNCPKLVERELCTSLIFSWMIQIVQSYEARFLENALSSQIKPCVGSLIPGSEIPRWFNNQFVSMDNSIKIDTSLVMHENNWIGVVCCAIFHVGNESEIIDYTSIDHSARIPPVDLRTDQVIDHSDHMWLFYLSRQEFGGGHYDFRWYKSYNGVISVEFRRLVMEWSEFRKDKDRYVNVYVKKYGYRRVYEKDRQLPNSGTRVDITQFFGTSSHEYSSKASSQETILQLMQ